MYLTEVSAHIPLGSPFRWCFEKQSLSPPLSTKCYPRLGAHKVLLSRQDITTSNRRPVGIERLSIAMCSSQRDTPKHNAYRRRLASTCHVCAKSEINSDGQLYFWACSGVHGWPRAPYGSVSSLVILLVLDLRPHVHRKPARILLNEQ